MTSPAGQTAYERARASVDAGRFDEALSAADEAFTTDPTDGPIRELYVGLNLALAIRLTAHARDLRRLDIAERGIRREQEFEDSERVRRAFEDALASFDKVLAVDPNHEKALTLKASALHRFDRTGRREESLALLRRVVAANPRNRQVLLAIKKVERVCEECSDTGFCAVCGGRGFKPLLGVERQCTTCWGQGICLRCGIL